MSDFVATRQFPTVKDAQIAYGQLAGAVAGTMANPNTPTPGVSVFLMYDEDSPAAFVTVIGTSLADVINAANSLGGEDFEMPHEHVKRMRERRRISMGDGVQLAGFVYHEPARLRDDGRMEPA